MRRILFILCCVFLSVSAFLSARVKAAELGAGPWERRAESQVWDDLVRGDSGFTLHSSCSVALWEEISAVTKAYRRGDLFSFDEYGDADADADVDGNSTHYLSAYLKSGIFSFQEREILLNKLHHLKSATQSDFCRGNVSHPKDNDPSLERAIVVTALLIEEERSGQDGKRSDRSMNHDLYSGNFLLLSSAGEGDILYLQKIYCSIYGGAFGYESFDIFDKIGSASGSSLGSAPQPSQVVFTAPSFDSTFPFLFSNIIYFQKDTIRKKISTDVTPTFFSSLIHVFPFSKDHILHTLFCGSLHVHSAKEDVSCYSQKNILKIIFPEFLAMSGKLKKVPGNYFPRHFVYLSNYKTTRPVSEV